MNERIDSLNIASQIKPINKDIIVEYTPSTNVVSYSYTLYKNEEIIDTYNSNTNKKTSIIMDETGVYKIVIKEIDSSGKEITLNSGFYNIDKEKPIIEVSEQLLTMELGDKLDLFSDVKVTDNFDGNLTNKITTNYNELDFNTTGIKKLVYTVSDEAGNIASKTVNINVVSNVTDSLIYIQIGIITILIAILYLLLSFRRSVNLEKRISKFSIKPIKDNSLSLFDNILKFYKNLVSKISNVISKSVFIQKYSKRFEKYLSLSKHTHSSAIDFVSSKLIIGFSFVLMAIFSKTIQYQVLSIYEVCIPFLIGFFVLDIIYFSKYKIYRNKIENDLLQAIIVMNNAFKSGRSITQAIELVTTELDGEIALEFRKMNMELSFGLGIDVVFDRFAKRIDLEEVTYLTASLSILNKTGGNIIKVFSSIERSLFNKKKLNLELKAFIGSSKIIAYVLFFVPIFFIILVSLINPNYFAAFFTNPIGIVMLIFMIVYYITYIVVVNKVMKVRM